MSPSLELGNTVIYPINGHRVKRITEKNDGPPTTLQLVTRMVFSVPSNLFKSVKGLINRALYSM